MPRSRNIVVIGAGVIGCAVAAELARRGAAVTVVDDRLPGMGATQASAGILAPYIEAREGSPMLDLAVRGLDLFDEFMARVNADADAAVEYHRTGTLDVAADDAGRQVLAETAAVLSRRGVAAELIDGAAARRLEPHLSNGVIAGLLIETHGFVAAGALTSALAASARRHGAEFVKRRVIGVTRHGSALRVNTVSDPLDGDGVVLAAGSWSGSLAIEGVRDALPVRPVRGQLLYLSWNGPPLARVTWSNHCYLVPWEDETVLVGATMEEAGFDERATAAGVRDLLEAACEIVPHAWTAGFRAARVGLRPASPDALPIIGLSTVLPDLMYATGHFRNGILLAPLTAAFVADAMLEGRVDPLLAPAGPARFGPF